MFAYNIIELQSRAKIVENKSMMCHCHWNKKVTLSLRRKIHFCSCLGEEGVKMVSGLKWLVLNCCQTVNFAGFVTVRHSQSD